MWMSTLLSVLLFSLYISSTYSVPAGYQPGQPVGAGKVPDKFFDWEEEEDADDDEDDYYDTTSATPTADYTATYATGTGTVDYGPGTGTPTMPSFMSASTQSPYDQDEDGEEEEDSELMDDTLLVRYGTDQSQRGIKSFLELPLTVEDAVAEGWTMDVSVDACNPPGVTYWRGWRYRLDDDKSLSLIFNFDGDLVGLQTAISPIDEASYPDSLTYRNVFNVEGDTRVGTVYFSSPDRICSPMSGVIMQAVGEPTDDRMGSQLYIQTGQDPLTQYAHIHRSETELVSKSMWKPGSCSDGLGKHYWFNTTADMPCQDFVPIALVYQQGKLAGFSWVFLDGKAGYESTNYEKMTTDVTQTFFQGNMPTCLTDQPLVTMHFFFEQEPWEHHCAQTQGQGQGQQGQGQPGEGQGQPGGGQGQGPVQIVEEDTTAE